MQREFGNADVKSSPGLSGHRIDRIADNVRERLSDFAMHATHLNRGIAELAVHRNVVTLKSGIIQFQYLVQQGMNLKLPGSTSLAMEPECLSGDLRDALQLAFRRLQVLTRIVRQGPSCSSLLRVAEGIPTSRQESPINSQAWCFSPRAAAEFT
jgi:hypothetical protein